MATNHVALAQADVNKQKCFQKLRLIARVCFIGDLIVLIRGEYHSFLFKKPSSLCVNVLLKKKRREFLNPPYCSFVQLYFTTLIMEYVIQESLAK